MHSQSYSRLNLLMSLLGARSVIFDGETTSEMRSMASFLFGIWNLGRERNLSELRVLEVCKSKRSNFFLIILCPLV